MIYGERRCCHCEIVASLYCKSPSGAAAKDKNKPKKKPAPTHERELQ